MPESSTYGVSTYRGSLRIHLHGMWSDLEDEQGNFMVRKHTIDMPPGSKRGPAPKIQQQLERVAALPKSEQRVIAKVLDSMLAQSSSG